MMQPYIPYAAQLMQAIGWSLLHSLWQGAVIWLVLAAIFRAFPAMNARIKHGCALMALLLLTLWVANTAVTQWQQSTSVAVRIIPGDAAAAAGYVVEVPAYAPGIGSMTGPALPRLEALMPWLMLCYGIGLLAMLLRLGGALARLHSLRRRGTTLPDERWLQLLRSLQLQVGIAQTVLLRFSERVAVPVVIGALRPLILLPATMVEDLGPEGLEAILLHELAHISRADFLINIFQSLVETLLFFNPFVWRISAAIRREREHCCDDLVIAHTRQPLIYARALTSLALRQRAIVPDLTLAATGHQPLLLNRIKRIIEMKNHPLRYGHIIAACTLAALIITVSIVCFTPSLAQQRKKTATEKTDQQKPGTTRYSRTNIIITDSNGIRHEYSSMDELPPADRERYESGMKALKHAQTALQRAPVALPALGAMPALAPLAPAYAEQPEPADAPEPPEPPIPAIDWKEINGQIDSAMELVAAIDWHDINREISAGMAEAEKALSNPRIKREMRRGIAMARATVANMPDREKIMEESRHAMAAARRGMEEARAQMEQAREQMAEARKEMQRKEKGKRNAGKEAHHD